jgi:hypothetical protein
MITIPIEAEPRLRPSELTVEEARMRAVQYRLMAATATSQYTREALERLAERYERLVLPKADGAQKEGAQGGTSAPSGGNVVGNGS